MPICSCAAAPPSDREPSIRIRSSRPTTASTQAQVSWGGPWPRTSRGRYLVYCDQGAWTVECGAINGVPSEPETARHTGAVSAKTTRRHLPAPRARAAGRAAEERNRARFRQQPSRRSTSPRSPACRRRRCPWPSPATRQTGAAIEDSPEPARRAREPRRRARRGQYALTASDGRLTLTPSGGTRRSGSPAPPATHLRGRGGGARARLETGDAVGTQPEAAEPPDGDGHVEGGASSTSSGWTAAVRRSYDGGEAVFTFTRVGRPVAQDPGPLQRAQPHGAGRCSWCSRISPTPTASTSCATIRSRRATTG